ncbi:MAG: DNA starvation/stationary phase protection protein Dps [Alphaproteobacteria bacterium]|nr:DNA starvation/stationary phase protection protein Dps [Alphaproteobacteria bacterium]
MHKTSIDLPLQTRDAMARLLNARLADTIDLSLQIKQAHWNVKGPNFIALHELFDRLHGEAEAYYDDIAERVTALGGTAYGTSKTVAENSTLPDYPANITAGLDHVKALAASYAALGKVVRADIETAAGAGDADTADLFTGLSRGLDKTLWFLEAHLQAKA